MGHKAGIGFIPPYGPAGPQQSVACRGLSKHAQIGKDSMIRKRETVYRLFRC